MALALHNLSPAPIAAPALAPKSENTALAACISHELNTPLGAMGCTLATLRSVLGRLSDAGLDPEQRQHLLEQAMKLEAEAGRAQRRIAKVVGAIGQLSGLDRDELGPVDLRATVDQALALLDSRLEGISVLVAVDRLPPVLGSAQQLGYAILALLKNALATMADGGLLHLRSEAHDKSVTLTIADSGEGMDQETLSTLFRPSFGVGSGRVEGRLELHAARRVVVDHGGGIEVESAVGRGTRVSLTLPRAC